MSPPSNRSEQATPDKIEYQTHNSSLSSSRFVGFIYSGLHWDESFLIHPLKIWKICIIHVGIKHVHKRRRISREVKVEALSALRGGKYRDFYVEALDFQGIHT